MTTSKMISALLGPVFLATGVMVLTNLGALPEVIREVSYSPTIMLLAGYFTFVPGLAIVHFHNRWSGGWPVVLVTACGWLLTAVGLMRILLAYRLAGLLTRLAPTMLQLMPVVACAILIVGGLLTFQGFRRG